MAELRIGVDTGGTFTDLVVLDRGRARAHKLASTPEDPTRAVLAGVAALTAGGGRPVDCVHGTTVGLNALLTGRHARVALITGADYLDLVEVGRQDRRDLYALEPSRAPFPVPRALRFGVPGRRDHRGRVLEPLPDAAVAGLLPRLRRAAPEALAIGLLHSTAAPADERRVARHLRALGLPITCSADLAPRPGEFERFTAACLNAAIQPVVSGYLERLERGLRPGRVRLLRNSGGIVERREATRFPLRAVLSGPAGGVVAAGRVAAALGAPRLVAFDMGGTSTDVSLVSAEPRAGDGGEQQLAGLPLAVPTFDVHTIGCGGGSLAYADAGGALRVGPESAGAEPGPACYGRGDEPTVTDAHVALGHLGPSALLGGGFPIDADRAVHAIERLARRLGTGSAEACARGILEVAEVAMARAILRITSERAVDPAGLPLLAYGGAGGLHAATLARRLAMPAAWLPAVPGAFSALGLALAAASIEQLEPLEVVVDAAGERRIRTRARELAAAVRGRGAELPSRTRLRADVRLRFAGQGGGLWLAVGPRLAARFGALHRQRFGFDDPSRPVEAVEIRVRADGPARRYPAQVAETTPPPGAAGRRRAPLGGAAWRVLPRAALAAGERLRGPAIIEEPTGCLRIPAGASARVEALGIRISP